MLASPHEERRDCNDSDILITLPVVSKIFASTLVMTIFTIARATLKRAPLADPFSITMYTSKRTKEFTHDIPGTKSKYHAGQIFVLLH